jgi:hypothetical protein
MFFFSSRKLEGKSLKTHVQFSLSISPKMNVIAILILFSIFVVTSTSIEEEWKNFKVKFKKTYKSATDEANKFEIFRENFEYVRKHNRNKTASYRLEMNREGDMTDDESVEMLEKLETG